MRHLTYLAVLAGCLAAALLLEPLLRVGVLRRWRRLARAVLPVAAVFVLWDVAAIAAGHWSYDRGQVTGVLLPGRLPLEELLFFLVVPVCAVLGFEAVRAVRHYPVGDEPAGDEPVGDEPAGDEPVGDEPVGDEPVGDEPVGDEPVGDEPAGDEPAGREPAGEDGEPAARESTPPSDGHGRDR